MSLLLLKYIECTSRIYQIIFALNVLLYAYSPKIQDWVFTVCVVYICINEFVLHCIFGRQVDVNYRPYETFENAFAKLYYEGTIPVLEYKSSLHSSFHRGVIQGRVLYKSMLPLVFKFYPIFMGLKFLSWIQMTRISRRYQMFQSFPSIQKWISSVQLSPNHVQEIRGLVAGYNENVHPWFQITYEYALVWHLLPDMYCMLGCSTLVFLKNPPLPHMTLEQIQQFGKSPPLVARHMDFCSLGSAGADSLIIKDDTMSFLTVPGIVGVITGWRHGLRQHPNLCVIVNVAHNDLYKNPNGTPILFLAREYLESCSSVSDVWNFYKRQEIDDRDDDDKKNNNDDFKNKDENKDKNTTMMKKQPCASFHLTFVDQNDYGCISYRQTRENRDVLFDRASHPNGLSIFNFTYGQYDDDKHTSDSKTRSKCVERFRAKVEPEYALIYSSGVPLIRGLLNSPELNVSDTLHSCIFDFENGQVWIAKNNGFAAKSPHSPIIFC